MCLDLGKTWQQALVKKARPWLNCAVKLLWLRFYVVMPMQCNFANLFYVVNFTAMASASCQQLGSWSCANDNNQRDVQHGWQRLVGGEEGRVACREEGPWQAHRFCVWLTSWHHVDPELLIAEKPSLAFGAPVGLSWVQFVLSSTTAIYIYMNLNIIIYIYIYTYI
jgi:hypothetical protein